MADAATGAMTFGRMFGRTFGAGPMLSGRMRNDTTSTEPALADLQHLAADACRLNRQGSVHVFDGLLVTDTGGQVSFLNSVTCTGRTPDAPEAVERALDIVARSGRTFSWWAPSAPDCQGFRAEQEPGPTAYMAVDLSTMGSPSAPQGCTIELLDAGRPQTGFFEAAAVAFEDDPALIDAHCRIFEPLTGTGVTRLLQAVDGMHVCGTAIVHTARETPHTAGLYWVGVLPGWRGRGLGSALTRHAMDVARTLGRTQMVLQATPQARNVYARLGFVQTGQTDVWTISHRPANR